MTKFAPQEIYLLEIFISPEYFAELRDTWNDIIKHVEHSLDQFMLNIPPGYRNWPLSERPDVVWGEQILLNFRATFRDLVSAFIVLTHGDLTALRTANGPINDYKGQRECSINWMNEIDANRYFDLLNKANTIAGNICATEEPYWQPGDLLEHVGDRGPIVIPATLPEYRLNTRTTVRTGEDVKQPGIYLPNLDASCAQFLGPGSAAPSAIVLQSMKDLRHPNTGAKYGEEPIFEDKPCLWTLVERIGPSHTRAPESLLETAIHRTPSGDPWFLY